MRAGDSRVSCNNNNTYSLNDRMMEKSELISRREFFRKTIERSLPLFIVGSSFSSMLTSCDKTGQTDDYEKLGPDEISSAGGAIDGHPYVDLGLSVKWSLMNLGASDSYEYGDYKEFTEGSTGRDYDKVRLSLMNAGFDDGDSISGTSFDPVVADWGAKWKMPSREQFEELLNNCDHVLTTYRNVKGLMFTSKINGRRIFLPAAGRNDEMNIIGKGESGSYWSSTLASIIASNAYAAYMGFSSGYLSIRESSNIANQKYVIRPVSDEKQSSTSCDGNCSSTCSGNSSGNSCSECSTACSGSCKTACDYNCAATCDNHCYGSCNDSCGGTCRYVSAGVNCSGCAQTCYNRCYQDCSYACSANCQSSCVGGSK